LINGMENHTRVLQAYYSKRNGTDCLLKRTLGMNRVCNQTESKWCKVPT
jgi:hypothetical protein